MFPIIVPSFPNLLSLQKMFSSVYTLSVESPFASSFYQPRRSFPRPFSIKKDSPAPPKNHLCPSAKSLKPECRDWLWADFAKASSSRTLDFAEAHLVVRRAQRTMRGCRRVCGRRPKCNRGIRVKFPSVMTTFRSQIFPSRVCRMRERRL
jgi:hypothetical protein